MNSTRYQILTDSLIDEVAADADKWLIVEPHPDFQGRWIVQSLSPHYLFEFEHLVGSYRALAPARLSEFLDTAEGLGYKVAFGEDPSTLLDAWEGLDDVPSIEIRSGLEGTINGLLPYQVQGFNYLKDLDGGVALWSTGTGKTVLATALLRYHLAEGTFDTAFFVVKTHNKVNTQRAVLRLGDIETFVIEGDRKQRERLYADFAQVSDPVIAITNYEKFRVDQDEMLMLFEDRRILILWDEMPTKLKTRGTALYKSVRKCLYRSTHPIWEKKRPSELRQYMLSATPIENDPEDFFSCVRLLDPRVFGTVAEFRNQFVARYNYFRQTQPEAWHNLEKMGLLAAPITHQVDKADPSISKQFPSVIEEPYYIDWDPKDRKIYDEIAGEVRRKLDERLTFDSDSVLAMIGVMQMLCDAPSMVADSAARREAFDQAWDYFVEQAEYGAKPPSKEGSETALKLFSFLGEELTNERHTKLRTLQELITDSHPHEKILVFSAFDITLLPILEGKLKEWKVPFVSYRGNEKQRQEAIDSFQSDEKVRVFLSSDRGSDSLNFEMASVVIHYDLPWKWSTYIQRQNRVHRVTSDFDKVRYYTLMMANSIEDRKMDIIHRKQGYHDQIFSGVEEHTASSKMSREDLLYILTGELADSAV